jgi:hypothetical protein
MGDWKKLTRIFLVLLLSLNFAPDAWSGAGQGAGGTSSGATHPTVQEIPNGYMAGREDAHYGTYSSPVQQSARSYQDRMMDLENKAFGLSGLAGADNVVQSEAVYLLENEVLRLYRDIAEAPESSMSDFERLSLLAGTTRAYQQTRHHAERLYENMIRFIDHALPGPNGLQIRSGGVEPLYSPNYRSDQELSETEKQAEYQKKVDSFLRKGGSWNEIKTLTPASFRKFSSYTRVEYVWLEDGTIRVTEGNAGHLLLAQGKAVRSAGQFVFLKDRAGKFPMMIVTNASGSYKPDIVSAEDLAYTLQRKLGISPDLTVVTKGEPVSTQAVRVYLKGMGKSPDEIDRRAKALEAEAHGILFPPPLMLPECAYIFSAAS